MSEPDAGSLFLVDELPAEISFWNGDIDAGGADVYSGSAQIGFSQINGAGISFDPIMDFRVSTNLTPPQSFSDCSTIVQDDTYRDDVRYLCFNPTGTFLTGTPAPTIEFSFRFRIN